MEAEEILCLAILPEDLVDGRHYARLSISHTFDRMAFGADDRSALCRRLAKIIQGKSCEATLVRFLRSHGIAHTTRDGLTPHTDPDRFDLRILNQIVDLKTFRVPRSVATPARLLNCLALVPDQRAHDQWLRRRHYERYVFGFIDGNIRVRLSPDGERALHNHAPLDDKDLLIETTPLKLYVTAAPTVAECEQKFRKVRAGTRCPQYPGGTRIDNMGCRIGELPSFREFINL